MRIVDVNQIEQFSNVFPELTTKEQLETAMLFSLGLSKKEIASARNVAYRTVEHSLEDIKARYDLYSLNDMLSIFQVRLSFLALSGCSVKKPQGSSLAAANRYRVEWWYLELLEII
ncbi:transcriptional regulator [Arsenophonus sp. ENCA]|uniref:helix-turn-helix transcriptional regulator n=1 Tax=Arsenophonus sp. ENCA TaxID=1987579 RepID=UPI0025C4AF1E|nr:transcriptional regulator [Arsenophonus sp. ENCA]